MLYAKFEVIHLTKWTGNRVIVKMMKIAVIYAKSQGISQIWILEKDLCVKANYRAKEIRKGGPGQKLK